MGAKRILVAMLCLTSAPSALSRPHAIEAELTAVLSAYTAHREDDRSGRTLLTDASALQSSQGEHRCFHTNCQVDIRASCILLAV